MKGKIIGLFFGILVVGLFVFLTANPKQSNGIEIEVYKSPTCGCCTKYIPYLKNEGYDVKVIATENMDEIKEKYGVPSSMESCHTAIVQGYFVEGHVPMDVVEKLIKENPDIDGIALPGMPAGSPGMPGTKQDDFVIHSIKNKIVGNYLTI